MFVLLQRAGGTARCSAKRSSALRAPALPRAARALDAPPSYHTPARHDCRPRSLQAGPEVSAAWAAGQGRKTIAEALQLCEESQLDGEADVRALRDWAASAWDYLVSARPDSCTAAREQRQPARTRQPSTPHLGLAARTTGSPGSSGLREGRKRLAARRCRQAPPWRGGPLGLGGCWCSTGRPHAGPFPPLHGGLLPFPHRSCHPCRPWATTRGPLHTSCE